MEEKERDAVQETCEDVEEVGFRVCDGCGCHMDEGYVIGDGELHYCQECLDKLYTKEEWEAMCEEDEDANYWTSWVEEIGREQGEE